MDIDTIETITFNIPTPLKMSFQIKTIKEKTNMTDKLLEFIRNYVKESN